MGGAHSTTASLPQLLERYQSLTAVRQRAVAAIVGAAVGDAASQPLNWIYDMDKLNEVIGDGTGDIFFWPTSESPFHRCATGSRTCYSDIAFILLHTLPAHTTEITEEFFNKKQYCENLAAFFSPDSKYGVALKLRTEMYGQGIKEPVEGPWQLSDVTAFLQKYHDGDADPCGNAESKESTGFVSAIPLIAKLACVDVDWELSSTLIHEAARIVTPFEFTVKHSMILANILSKAIREEDFSLNRETVHNIITASTKDHPEFGETLQAEWEEIILALDNETPFPDAVGQYGRGCDIPGWFKASILALLLNGKECGFKSALRRNIQAGGGSSSRANFLGSMMGALYGLQLSEDNTDGIPVDWIEKTEHGLYVFEKALNLVD